MRGLWLPTTLLAAVVALTVTPAARPAGPDRAGGPTKSADTLISQASERQKDREYEEAAKLWKAALREFPGDSRLPLVRHNLAVCLFETGKAAEAAELCRTVLKDSASYPHADDVRLLLGMALADAARRLKPPDPDAAKKLLSEAKDLFEGRLQADPKSESRAFVLYNLGIVCTDLQIANEGGRAFDSFLKDFPTHHLAAEVRLRRGTMWLSENRPAEAEPLLREAAEAKGFPFADLATVRLAASLFALGKKDKAAQLMTGLSTRFPKSTLGAVASAQGASWLAADGKVDEAVKVIHRLLDEGAAEAQHPAVEVARLTAQTDPKLAEATAAAALKKFPSGSHWRQLRLWRGVALCASNRPEEAIKDLNAARKGKLDPDQDADAGRLVGICLAQRGKHEEAVKEFEDVLALHKNYKRADAVLFERALSIEACRPDAAAEAFERVAKDKADSPLAADALVRAGERHAGAKAYPAAVRCFTAALPKAGDAKLRDFARSRLGWCLLESKDNDGAAAAFDQLVKDKPGEELTAAGHYFGALAHDRAGAPAAALERYLKAAASGPRYSEAALIGAGDASLKLGKSDDAQTYFSRLLTSSPKSPHAQDARLGLARVMQAKRRWNEAAGAFEAIVEERTNTLSEARATFHLAEARAALGKPREAAVAFCNVEAYGFESLAGEALFRAAELYRSLGDGGKTRACYARLSGAKYASHPRAKAAADWLKDNPK